MKEKRNLREDKFLGYVASTEFILVLKELDRLEELLIGVIDSGANEINSVEYQISNLKKYRAEARKKAVQEGIEKAKVYCEAANIELGAIIHITDVNPDRMRYFASHGQPSRSLEPDHEELERSFDAGAITVGGAVMLAFSLK